MIKLNIESRCQECHMFETYVNKEQLFDGVELVETITEITCKNNELCNRLIEFLKNQQTECDNHGQIHNSIKETKEGELEKDAG